LNVNDFKDVEVPEGDLLEGIFAAQRELMDEYHGIEEGRGFIVIDEDQFGELDHRFVQFRIKDLMWRTTEEMAEAAGALKNRPWKQSERATDSVHYYEEIADAIHFFVEMLITSGMTPRDVAQIYHQKHAVNKFRQGSRY
jgi:phosphoribosyl-ATP pyrophosphohydrolase